MPKIVYVTPHSDEITVDVEIGQSLMQGSVRNNVPGIIGECGGEVSCGTCHVHIAHKWHGYVSERSVDENDLLEFMDEYCEDSRLACQVTVTEELDGMRVVVPPQ
ncbi:2Fe-2S iron-sulfur cluster-binding protein [Nocardia sp.]|uniref:2Fe-2S iron-sulfur cluster-binding protein n=1 Tax=Nocardia sp. TaxID=1821 RepID=UPI0026060A96|nr:2Fe-2S iron-sulfur cluster-binding protein [Nocardia sp.]